MRVTHNYMRVLFFVGFMVHQKHWSQTNQKVKKNREDEPDNNYLAINKRISLLKNKAENAINKALEEDIPITKEFLQNEIMGDMAAKRRKNLSFFDLLDEYIESSKAIKANRTVVCYGTFKNFLLDFEKDTRYRLISAQSISNSLIT